MLRVIQRGRQRVAVERYGGPTHPQSSQDMSSSGRLRVGRVFSLVLTGLAFPAPRAVSQTIRGAIVDDVSGRPIPTASALLLDSMDAVVRRTQSDSAGHFWIAVPRSGRYQLYISRWAYLPVTSVPITFQDDARDVEIEFRLVPAPVELEGMTVTADARGSELTRVGFYRRKAASGGTFFDSAQIADLRPFHVTDLLHSVPGVRVTRTRLGEMIPVSRRTGCPLKVVLNGFKVAAGGRDGAGYASPDAFVDPSSLMGLEVYPGAGGIGAPVEQRGADAFCGVLMIWTR